MDSFLGDPFSDMVKFVVDLKKETLAVGGELHSDAEALLIQDGSSQTDLWGGNFYPGNPKEKQIEFTSMINIRPSQGNMGRGVESEDTRKTILAVVDKWIKR